MLMAAGRHLPADSKEALPHDSVGLGSLALAVLFFAAWYAIPMWMTFKRPERHPDFAEARAYLRAKAALARGESVITVPAAGVTAARRHMIATRTIVPGRHHAGTGLAAGRSHPVEPHDGTRVSA
jgi:hypothetical protein